MCIQGDTNFQSWSTESGSSRFLKWIVISIDLTVRIGQGQVQLDIFSLKSIKIFFCRIFEHPNMICMKLVMNFWSWTCNLEVKQWIVTQVIMLKF